MNKNLPDTLRAFRERRNANRADKNGSLNALKRELFQLTPIDIVEGWELIEEVTARVAKKRLSMLSEDQKQLTTSLLGFDLGLEAFQALGGVSNKPIPLSRLARSGESSPEPVFLIRAHLAMGEGLILSSQCKRFDTSPPPSWRGSDGRNNTPPPHPRIQRKALNAGGIAAQLLDLTGAPLPQGEWRQIGKRNVFVVYWK